MMLRWTIVLGFCLAVALCGRERGARKRSPRVGEAMKLRGETTAKLTVEESAATSNLLLKPTEIKVVPKRRTLQANDEVEAAEDEEDKGKGKGKGSSEEEESETMVTVYEEVACIDIPTAEAMMDEADSEDYYDDDYCLDDPSECAGGCCRVVDSMVFCDTTNDGTWEEYPCICNQNAAEIDVVSNAAEEVPAGENDEKQNQNEPETTEAEEVTTEPESGEVLDEDFYWGIDSDSTSTSNVTDAATANSTVIESGKEAPADESETEDSGSDMEEGKDTTGDDEEDDKKDDKQEEEGDVPESKKDKEIAAAEESPETDEEEEEDSYWEKSCKGKKCDDSDEEYDDIQEAMEEPVSDQK